MTALDRGLRICSTACGGGLHRFKMGHGERDQGAQDHQGS